MERQTGPLVRRGSWSLRRTSGDIRGRNARHRGRGGVARGSMVGGTGVRRVGLDGTQWVS